MEPIPRRRFRFSLLTLLLFSLLAGGVWLFVLRYRGGPWKRTVLLKDFSGDVYLSPRGAWVAYPPSSHYVGALTVLNVRDGTTRILPSRAISVYFSADETILMSKAPSGNEFWDLSRGTGISFIESYWNDPCAISGDGARVAFEESEVERLWDIHNFIDVLNTRSKSLVRHLELGEEIEPMSMTFSNDGKWLAHGTRSAKGDPHGERVVLWNIDTGEKREFPLPDFPGTDPILFSPHDDFLLLGRAGTASFVGANEPYYTRIVDTATFSDKGKIDVVIDADAESFSPDGRYLVWGDGTGYIVFDFKNPQSFKTSWGACRASFSPSCGRVLTSHGLLHSFPSHLLIMNFGNVKDARFLDDNTIVTEEYRPEPLDWKAVQPVSICRWERHYPEAWWGFACLWEFWPMILLACGVGWSILRDRRILRGRRIT
ncbi:MAG TPA: hypothetical protein VKX17_02795 [Planctomycetota bacterium]|nr:hypothetical protein [Planctomycetota bacterium]